MALAGAGVAGLLVARPLSPPQPLDHPLARGGGHPYGHSALVAAHPVVLGLAWLSLGVSLIHFAVIQEHFADYWAYGAFFIVVATVQMAWAVLMVVRPSRLMLALGAAGNALVLAAWIVTRTVGSLIGPEATQPAEAGFGDIVSTAFEAAIVVGALLMLRRRRLSGPNPVEAHWSEVAKALAAIGITLLTVLALFSTVGGSPFVSHVG